MVCNVVPHFVPNPPRCALHKAGSDLARGVYICTLSVKLHETAVTPRLCLISPFGVAIEIGLLYIQEMLICVRTQKPVLKCK